MDFGGVERHTLTNEVRPATGPGDVIPTTLRGDAGAPDAAGT